MDVFTWLSSISTKAEFSALMSLVENGSLEEMFIAQTTQKSVAGKEFGNKKALVFSFSKDKSILGKLEEIATTFSLDDVEDDYFEEIDGEYTLKGVLYPASSDQEEKIINKLL